MNDPVPTDANTRDADTAGVAFAPPLGFALPLLAGLVLDRALLAENGVARRALGAGYAIAGASLIGGTARRMRAAGTNVIPFKPTTAIVSDGSFAVSRNPIYLGFALVYVGTALLRRSGGALALFPLAFALTDRYVIDREERYLSRKFGDAYRAYATRVPRWF